MKKDLNQNKQLHSAFNKKLNAFVLFCGCNTVNKQF